MFTGIVRGLAAVVRLEDRPGQRTLWIALPADWAEGLARGASVAINGVCLTAVDIATAAGPRVRQAGHLGLLRSRLTQRRTLCPS